MAIWQTGVSQAFWYSPGKWPPFSKAKINIGGRSGDAGKAESCCWLDELFKGGLTVPDHSGRALTMLLTGPPGTGKTTLALELCYRLADPSADRNQEQGALFSLYISTDSTTEQLISHAKSLGYQSTDRFILPFAFEHPAVPHVAVWGTDHIQKWGDLTALLREAVDAVTKWLLDLETKGITGRMQQWLTRRPSESAVERATPDILVVDNLNVIDATERGKFFEAFRDAVATKTKLMIFVLDSASSDTDHKYWEYGCDIVLQLNNESTGGYFRRTLEIVKARYQEHVLGQHQFKIYCGTHVVPESQASGALERAHPYREEGGIFIYPSIHYYLSAYKKAAYRSDTPPIDVWPEALDKIVQFPAHRCTAFIGARGGHKSHLGYVNLLNFIGHHGTRRGGLVISLRDDEAMTRGTLKTILMQEEELAKKTPDLLRLEHDDNLEILYYHPGYITPEEFFHRMFVSIQRLKRSNEEVMVLFNSLDQLSARFPLCAREEIFIPGILECLSGEGVTSIFIGVDEPDQPVEQFGLLPMADLILSFYPYRFAYSDYLSYLGKPLRDSSLEARTHESVVIEVVRYAGGKRAGSKGILELVDPSSELYSQAGLNFTAIEPDAFRGVRSERFGGSASVKARTMGGSR